MAGDGRRWQAMEGHRRVRSWEGAYLEAVPSREGASPMQIAACPIGVLVARVEGNHEDVQARAEDGRGGVGGGGRSVQVDERGKEAD